MAASTVIENYPEYLTPNTGFYWEIDDIKYRTMKLDRIMPIPLLFLEIR